MRMNAELRHVDAFLAVARLSSFTRAAAALRVSQPALTVQIKQLEEAFGVRLFDRNNRRVTLTPAGRDLVAPLERIMHDFDAVAGHARDLADHRRGMVTVAALPSIAAGLLPRAIRTLSDSHDGIVVRVRDVIGGRVVDLVKAGEVDFGIGSIVRPDAELTSQPLLTDRLCAFAPDDHPIARKRHITLRDLSTHPLILTSHDSSVRQLVERALEHARFAAHVAQEASYMATAIGMVKAGLGVAVLPESALAGMPADGIHAVAITTPALRREINILTSAGRSMSPAAQKLVEVLRRARPRSA
jgi:LysR family transcriptional regulator, carnitine catabolism transcriptional activator